MRAAGSTSGLLPPQGVLCDVGISGVGQWPWTGASIRRTPSSAWSWWSTASAHALDTVVSFPPATETIPSGPLESIVSRCARAVATAPTGSTLTPAKRARTGPSASASSASAASSRICRSSAAVGAIVRASPSKALSVVPTRRRPAQGTAKATRVRSIGIVTAAPQPPSRSSTRCAPLLSVTDVPACGILQPPDVVDPRPGGVDDGARADLERLPGQRVSELGDRPAFEPGQLDPVDHGRARIGRAAQVGEAEPCVIGLGVGVETGGAKAVEPERRHERRRGSGRDHPPPLRDGARQSRVRPERPADGNTAVRAAAVDREHELQRRARDGARRSG